MSKVFVSLILSIKNALRDTIFIKKLSGLDFISHIPNTFRFLERTQNDDDVKTKTKNMQKREKNMRVN